jgi:hypothetical protein
MDTRVAGHSYGTHASRTITAMNLVVRISRALLIVRVRDNQRCRSLALRI